MLTPLDIENKKFPKSIKGYNEDEVDDFLDQLTIEYEKLYRENADLKSEVESMKRDLEHYRSIEHTLQNTLVMAQKTADQMISEAKNSAEKIKKDADEEASRTLDGAQSRAKATVESLDRQEFELRKKYEETKKKFEIYRSKMEMILVSQLDMLNDMKDDEE